MGAPKHIKEELSIIFRWNDIPGIIEGVAELCEESNELEAAEILRQAVEDLINEGL